MRITKIICDCCGEEIPKAKKKDFFGNEIEYYRLGKLNFGEPFNNINPHNILGIDLCERCTGNISMDIYKVRMEMISKLSVEHEKTKNRKIGRQTK